MSTWSRNTPRLTGPLRTQVVLSVGLVPLLLSIAFAAVSLSWHDRLPDPVAIHFGPGGEPDDWMSLTSNYVYDFLMLFGFSAVNLCLALFGAMRGKSGLLIGSILSGTVGLLSVVLLATLYIQLDGAEPNLGGQAFLIGLVGFVVCAAITALTFPSRDTEPEKPGRGASERGPRKPLRAGESVAFFGSQSGSPVFVGMVALAFVVSTILVGFVAWWAVAIVAVSALIAIPMISFLKVRIDGSTVTWSFGFGFPRGTIDLDDIASVEALDINPMDFGGWGYRTTETTTGLIVRGGPGIRIHRKSGKPVIISLAEPDEAVETLRQLLARAKYRRMSIRVAQWATGAVGSHSLGLVLDRPELELVGVLVSDPAKTGEDAARLAGRSGSTGIVATTDREALLLSKPDVVINAADADTRMEEAVDDLEWLLRNGIDVVASGPVVLQYPWGTASPKWIERLEAATAEGKSTLHVTGIDPGFANDVLPLTLTSIASRIDSVRAFEISDFSTYDNPAIVEGFFGFGMPLDSDPVIALPGVLASGWGGTVRQLAAALDVTLDKQLTEHVERRPAPSDIDTVCTHVGAGTQAALRFEVIGTVDGEPRIALEHVLRARTDLGADLAPGWAAPAGGGPASFRVEIAGEPNLRLELTHLSSAGDHGASGMLTTAARLANSVEAVHAATPGIVSAKDLPPVTGRGLVTGSR